ncbi:MAG: SDR family oxidoreductase [Lachnospiraceae bacterium]|nr:SDR family oxidoreductase [Lachnospiraceae bacterium]
MTSLFEKFRIEGQVIVITGGAGLIGRRHTEAVLEGGGIPVLLDIFPEPLKSVKEQFLKEYPEAVLETFVTDITKKEKLEEIKDILLEKYGHIDGLINNAANNPKMEGGSNNMGAIQFHNLPLSIWNDDMAVGLTGAFLCAQVFGTVMEKQGKGVVINVASDYGIISPDQRIYRKEGIPEEEQIIKPISYSVVKHGLIGMTKYLATYWAKKGVRVNTLCPASLENGQAPEFIEKISNLIPMGRMSRPEEYPATVLYMLSEASSYMTGATVLLDGGRTIW